MIGVKKLLAFCKVC